MPEATPARLITQFPGRDAVIDDAIGRWSANARSAEHVSDGACFTYRFATDEGQARYLRLVPPHWRTREELEGELAYIDHLAARDIPLARPVPSARGHRIEAVATEIGECFALAFEAIQGNAADDVHWSPDQARAAGRLMARTHVAVGDFTLPEGTERPSWMDEFEAIDAELDPSDREMRAIVDETVRAFKRLPTTHDTFGMVHFDLSGDNIVWRDLEPTVIDFDDCMWHWYVADIARTVAYFRIDDRGAIGDRERAFMDGYNDVRMLDAQWRALMPRFLRFALVCELGWITHAARMEGDRSEFSVEDEALIREIIRGLTDASSA